MNGFRRTTALLIGVSAAFLANTAAAQSQDANAAARGCRLVVESGQDQWIVSYDPFVDATAERQFDMTVVNQGGAACVGVVGLDLRGESYGLSRNGMGERLQYAVVDERASADITPRTGETVRRPGGRPVTLPPGDRAVMRFSVVLNTAEVPSAGFYTQTAVLTFEHPNGTPLAERPVTIGTRIAPAAMIGLKGEFRRSQGVATIDLGSLSEGARPLNTTLYVLSTSGYSVSVSSANSGRLRQGSTDWYVPYTLRIGDQTVDLASNRSLDVISDRARFDDYPLGVSVGPVAGVRAGEYTDTVRFTVAAL